MACSLPHDPVTIPADTTFAVDSLVEAILDAVDPGLLKCADAVRYLGGEVVPIVVVRLNAAQWELSIDSWARVAGELSLRSRGRPLNLPSLAAPMQTLLDGGGEALRAATAFRVRGAH